MSISQTPHTPRTQETPPVTAGARKPGPASGAKPDQKTAGGIPVMPGQPTPGQPIAPRTYPRLLYRATDVYPGFEHVKVESADDEKKVLEDPEPGLGWFDTPDDAKLSRDAARRPYNEFGRTVPEPLAWPPSVTAGQKAAAIAEGEEALAKLAPPPAPDAAAVDYPKIKYQAIDPETPPGYKYYKVNSAEDEAALSQLGPDPWYDTPAEAIASPPAGTQPGKGGGSHDPHGQRPAQTSLAGSAGPALPLGQGGSATPGAKPPAQGEDDDEHAKSGGKGNGGKHK